MSLIEAARRLAEIDPWYEHERAGTSFCIACGAYEDHTGRHHNPDCPWRAMPGIVVAMEAAERLVQPDYAGRTSGMVCTHDQPWQALVAALKEPVA